PSPYSIFVPTVSREPDRETNAPTQADEPTRVFSPATIKTEAAVSPPQPVPAEVVPAEVAKSEVERAEPAFPTVNQPRPEEAAPPPQKPAPPKKPSAPRW
ncbi:MAG: hypothetical protein M3347_02390, partial [Armatimonadota bacterium]|nr:hypothetical protein [Armatimonadota bacterium]